MRDEHPVDDYRWLWTVRPRRLNLGDLMFGVALAALGCCALALVLRSELSDERRAGFGVLTLLLFAMQAAQWRLGGVPVRDPRSNRSVALGIVSYLIAMVMFVVLVGLGALFPDGAALVVIAMIVTAIYLSTWE
jgi:peptidoglycan/LPS O-acetylase OafA/YrhL